MKRAVRIGILIAASLLALFLTVHLFGRNDKAGPRAGASASLNIGKTETSSSLFSASSSSASDDACFSSRHVLFFVDNPHPLSRQVAKLLEQQLKDCPLIERLEMTNGPFTLTDGANAPDLFLNVNLIGIKQSGLVSSSMRATITASLGDSLWTGNHYIRDDSTPPLVSDSWNATLESDTTFTGIRTDRYADAARSIADQFAKAVRKQLEDLSGKYPSLPELPREFYGPYQPVADFDFLKAVQGRRVGSYCGLFTHNQTFWQFRTATNPVPQLQRIVSQLEAAGWQFHDVQLTNTVTPYACGRRGDAELEIFRQHADFVAFPPDEPKESSLAFVAHYRKSFSRAEREAALEILFAEQRPIETLLPFQQSFFPAQRQKFFELVEKSPATSPRACIQLAYVYLDRKQTNAAVSLLTRAKALAATVKDSASLESDIESAAKKISPKQSLKLEVTPETCRELGFLELTNLTQSIEQERSLGQPLVFFGLTQRGVKIYALTVNRPQKDAYPWSLVQTEDGSRSSSSSSFTLNNRSDWQDSFTFNEQTVKITVVPLPGKKQVKFSIRIGS